MLSVVEVYNDVLDAVRPEQNGSVTIREYNRKSRLGELMFIDWLSGTISEDQGVPEPYTSQKLKDWLSVILGKKTGQVKGGVFAKPDDYDTFESMVILGKKKDNCDDEIEDTIIELLSSKQFEKRKKQYIKSLRPSMKKPIARLVGNEFEFAPTDVGSIKLIYRKSPIFGELGTDVDPVYNIEIATKATDYIWPEFARKFLVYFITKQYGRSNKDRPLQEQNELVGKTEKK